MKLRVLRVERGERSVFEDELHNFTVVCAEGYDKHLLARDELDAVIILQAYVRAHPDIYDPEIEFVEPEDV